MTAKGAEGERRAAIGAAPCAGCGARRGGAAAGADCGARGGGAAAGGGPRADVALLRRAERLEWFTVGWNVAEGTIGIVAALLAGSAALLGFGVDSGVESLSGVVLLWRLAAERRGADEAGVERIERRARRLVALSLFALAVYVAVEAGTQLWRGERPRPSIVGVCLTVVSAALMLRLARAKRRAAAALGSGALAADSVQTSACFLLSVVALAGLALNAAFSWWWADPVAALGVAALVAREGLEAWRGKECGCG